MNSEMPFSDWFAAVTGHATPRFWQSDLVRESRCHDRLIRVPTGLGKTEGVLAAWMWHRLERNESEWPRRLVWCLPMRVLVEQTQQVASGLLERWKIHFSHADSNLPAVECLMGGVNSGDWHLHPDRPAILLGTQDMLLSRALNRGYASGRARWPVEFGLLNQDCLWVMDEVQLMDVGLATSVQLQAFREQEQARSLRPCHTWWMSATLQEDWLETVDFRDSLRKLRREIVHVPLAERTGDVWEIRKPIRLETIPSKPKDDFTAWADLILTEHSEAVPNKTGRVTLVIVNTVDRAVEVEKAVTKAGARDAKAPQIELIHSRFRGIERDEWGTRFLSKQHCQNASTNLILIATQVVEAGVDISATALITELAPWPSLVQRFGRAARYSGTARIVVVDRQVDDNSALPYELPDLAAASEAVARLSDAGLAGLQQFEDDLRATDTEFLKRLYRYEYLHLLTRRECDELFDTSPDLTGADLDISRFIREGEERDVQICWLKCDWPENDQPGKDDRENSAPPAEWQPLRNGLCPVPVHQARKWLFDGSKLKDDFRGRAWSWDYLADAWQTASIDRCFAGQVFFVDVECGGYDTRRGFTGEKPGRKVEPLNVEGCVDRGQTAPQDLADLSQSRDDLSQLSASLPGAWKSIATHGREVADKAIDMLGRIGTDSALHEVFELAGLCHDWGKAHPVFQANIKVDEQHRGRNDLAKAPSWKSFRSREYSTTQAHGSRQGFRHELASTLALLELLARHDRWHPALLGPHRELIDHGILNPIPPTDSRPDDRLSQRLARLTAEQFNLLMYLIGTHHGKVRGAIQGTPQDQSFDITDTKLVGTGQPLRGVRDGDELPETPLFGGVSDSEPSWIPGVTLHLDVAAIGLSNRYGASWTERVQSLLSRFGPFSLAWLEAVFRAADAVASQSPTPDPLLHRPPGPHGPTDQHGP